jgi:tetratricopeptide (TPR) repeat protein
VKEGARYSILAIGDQPGELAAEAFYWAMRGDARKARRWLDWAKEDVSAGSGQDALRLPPFLRLWKDGKGDLKQAAAALCSGRPCNESGRKVLEAALAKAVADDERTALEHALLLTYAVLREGGPAVDTARRLRRQHPESKIARDLELMALSVAERDGDYRALLQKLVKGGAAKSEPMLQEWLAEVNVRLGAFEDAKLAYQAAIDGGQASAGTYNNRAWLALFTQEGVTDADVSLALQAVQLSGFKNPTYLNTLAALYAAGGKPDQAWQTYLQILELRPDGEPIEADWFVVGRVAEHYGLPETARKAYLRVSKPMRVRPTSTYVLAQRRLALLPASPATGQ